MSTVAKVSGVPVLHWNPRKPVAQMAGLNRLRIGARINNFGDLLGPIIVQSILDQNLTSPSSRNRLLSVGSILHFARDGDVVWGTGVNGKIPAEMHTFSQLDVRAVRGPETRAFLLDRGIECPATYGDPALLLPSLRPDLVEASTGTAAGHVIVPNLNDEVDSGLLNNPGVRYLDPRSSVETCLQLLVGADRITTSSLHGLIIAEAFGVPVVLVKSKAEPSFKFLDYVRGTGREIADLAVVDSFQDAFTETPRVGTLKWDPARLIAAFPIELWKSKLEQSTPGTSDGTRREL